MSAEAILISAIVEEGAAAMRQVYASGLTAESFAIYDEEFQWIERRLAKRRPITRRGLVEQFPDFEYQPPRNESVQDLAYELKRECALAEANQIVNSLASANKENIIEVLTETREQIAKVTRAHAPMSDVDLDEVAPVMEEMKQRRLLAAQGLRPGLTTGVNFIDHHLGGLLPGQFILISGRTGSAKSYLTMLLGWKPRKMGANVGVFSPEFNAHEVRSRYHTIVSADKEVQEAVGLSRSFRNRALMDGDKFNLKSYQLMLDYIDALPGRMRLLCGSGMTDQMSVGYIEDRIVEHELNLVIVDPIYMLKPVRTSNDGNEYQEVAWVAEALQRIGERYDIPIVLTNQAHLEGNKGDAPGIDKSWGSKKLLHMADYVLGVQHLSEESKIVVRCNKSRFGAGGWRFMADFLPNTGYFKVTTPLVGSYTNGSDGPEGSEEVVKRAVAQKGK